MTDNDWFWKILDNIPMKSVNTMTTSGKRLHGYKGEDADEQLALKSIPANALLETRENLSTGRVTAYVISTET